VGVGVPPPNPAKPLWLLFAAAGVGVAVLNTPDMSC
jgi:hypothetical protein